MVQPRLERLKRDDGETIAYLRRAGKPPSILWLGGFKSEMTGTKAEALDLWATEQGHACLRFDYFGHGQSSWDFRKGTISRWLDDTLAVLDRVAEGPQLLVGSSMGGWIALLAARARPDRVKGLLLIAPAVDFTQALLWVRLPQDVKEQIERDGEWQRPSVYDPEPYPITRSLIEDGRNHLLLDKPLAAHCPVRIVQGMQDPDVPWAHALKIAEAIEGDVTLTLVKNGDHRLSTPADLKRIMQTLLVLIEELQPTLHSSQGTGS
jgi:pimeloyl-ACP methyl ester carboxylesterase